jgi:hypothetical protein
MVASALRDLGAGLAGLLPLAFMLGLSLFRFAQGADRARAIVDAFLVWTIVSYGATELLGLFGQIAFLPFLVLWLVADGWILVRLWKARDRAGEYWQRGNGLPFWIVMGVAAVTLFIAVTAVPNNFDSQTYHLPRIEHWIQNGSLTFYPTRNSRQNGLGPLAEALLLQTRVLSGSDFFYQLVQWSSMACSIAAVFRITRQLGGSETQCWIAAVFVATLPIGILESTTTQNDYVVAALLACFVTLGIETVARPRASLGLVSAAAAAAGLSGAAKPTGYLLGAGFALWFAISLSKRVVLGVWILRVAVVLAVLTLVMAPSVARYVAGYGDQHEISINASFGVRQTLYNLIRSAKLNFNTGLPKVDALTNHAVEEVTSSLGLTAYRHDTSFPGPESWTPPVGRQILHEDFGPNLFHGILVLIALISTVVGWPTREVPLRLYYWGAWLIGIVIFASVIRWDPWQTRYQLPAFVLVAPAVARAWPEGWAESRKTVGLFLIMGLTALPALLLNFSRPLMPLHDRPSYLMQSYTERLFVNQPSLLEPYRDAVDVIDRSKASQVGLILGGNSWEYPIWSMLRTRKLDHPVRIEHVGLPPTQHYPLGPFVPDVLFWSTTELAPPTLNVDGLEFVRVGPPGTTASYVRS